MARRLALLVVTQHAGARFPRGWKDSRSWLVSARTGAISGHVSRSSRRSTPTGAGWRPGP